MEGIAHFVIFWNNLGPLLLQCMKSVQMHLLQNTGDANDTVTALYREI